MKQKIESIVNRLLNHEISKSESIYQIQCLFELDLETVTDWLKTKDMSVRLKNVLYYIQKDEPTKLISEIAINELRKYKNTGAGTVNEFIQLRGY